MLSFSQTISKSIGIVVAGIFLVLSPLLVCPVRADTAMIRVNNLYMRPGPTKKGYPLGQLNTGARVQVLKLCNGWLHIRHEGRCGYIINDPRYVTIIPGKKTPPETKTAPAQDFKQQARDVSHQLEIRQQAVQTITDRETAVINNLDRVDRKLNITTRQVALLKDRQKKLQDTIKSTKILLANLLEKIKTGETYASHRIVALYKLGQLGQIHVLASAENMYEFFKRRSALKRIIAHDHRVLEELTQNRSDLQKTLVDLNDQNHKMDILKQDLACQITLLADSKKKRTRFLAEIGRHKNLALAAIESLKQSALELDLKIRALGHETIETKRDAAEKLSNGFIDYKGLLKMPVKGKIVSLFGPHRNKKFNVVNFESGINIRADRGEPVRAVFGGRILYAGWLKGYGNMLIINHGESYYTLYAHAEELFKAKDDAVEKNEVIATVGDTGSMAGVRLHFEVRHHGKPMDPTAWIQKG
jgi:septal ring factor EnvC (AmiA/AmiB activator)